jgi:hypothetical protein
MSSSNQDLAKKLPLACRNTALSAHDLQFDSFELRYGYSWHLSAADCVHALTGLLVRHTKIGGAGPGSGAGGGGGAGADAAGGSREQGPEDVREEQAAAARDDFWWGGGGGEAQAGCGVARRGEDAGRCEGAVGTTLAGPELLEQNALCRGLLASSSIHMPQICGRAA